MSLALPGFFRTLGIDPLSLNPVIWFDMDTSMLAAGDVAATEGDMVATLENKVSGGPDATQTVSSEQSVAKIPVNGNPPYLLMDLVNDEYEFTTGGLAINGTIVVATLEGTYSANISLNASTQYDLQARGVAPSAGNGFLKNVIGYLITPSQLSDSEITEIEAYFVGKGAAARSVFASVTSFYRAWTSCNSLTSFPLIDTSSGTNLTEAWYNCSSLTSFPLIDTSSATNVTGAWRSCSSLTSFPLIDTSSGVYFSSSWRGCNSLTDFPANFFDNWSPASLTSAVFSLTWDGCTSLTAQSVENILTSLDTSGVYGTNTGASGGTQLADHTIDIDYDGTTLSGATTTAITNLKNKDWAIKINNLIQ